MTARLRGVRRLGELHQQIRRDLARLREPLENNVDVFAAPSGSCEQQHSLQRQKETAESMKVEARERT